MLTVWDRCPSDCLATALAKKNLRSVWLNQRDRSGRSVLHWISAEPDSEASVVLAKMLVQHGLDYTQVDKDGKSAWHVSAANGNLRLMSLLMEFTYLSDLDRIGACQQPGEFVNSTDYAPTSQYVTNAASLSSVHNLLTSVDDRGRTALHWAAYKGQGMTCKFLSSVGSPMHVADVLDWSYKDSSGRNALHRAAQGLSEEVLSYYFFDQRKLHSTGQLSLNNLESEFLCEDNEGLTIELIILKQISSVDGRDCYDFPAYLACQFHKSYIDEEIQKASLPKPSFTLSLNSIRNWFMMSIISIISESRVQMIVSLTGALLTTLFYHTKLFPDRTDWISMPKTSILFNYKIEAFIFYSLFPLTFILCDPMGSLIHRRKNHNKYKQLKMLDGVIGSNFRLMFKHYRYFSRASLGSSLWCWRPVKHVVETEGTSQRLVGLYEWKQKAYRELHDQCMDQSSGLKDGESKLLMTKWPLHVHCKSREFDPSSICYTCWVYKPLRSKHCRICGECQQVMDHHCDWIGRCVNHLNHRIFVVWLLTMSIAGILMIIGSARRVIHYGLMLKSSNSIVIINLLIWILVVWAYGWGSLSVVSILVEQLLCISWNMTVNERLNLMNVTRYPHFKCDATYAEKKMNSLLVSQTETISVNPFNRGMLLNIQEFILNTRHSLDDARGYYSKESTWNGKGSAWMADVVEYSHKDEDQNVLISTIRKISKSALCLTK
eukprot:GHVH01016917.1.p1 GENE.GHVH01016917.1~~GHVH01016917.1.p1  ORF type:complete len:717 (+),score=63.96 GHVH01016917.1:306-2456(+)